MSSIRNNRTNYLQTSLQFQKEFSYINLIQDELSRDKKRSRLKLKSKILMPNISKPQYSIKKVKSLNSLSKSQIRKKSKTVQRSPSKKQKSEKKLFSKKYERDKKMSKPILAKPPEANSKSNKSIKSCNLKKLYKQESTKRLELFGRKKSKKDQHTVKVQKTLKSNKNKSTGKLKIKKIKSLNEFENIPLSSITKQHPKLGPKQSKVIDEYFGMDDKLSSINQHKYASKKPSSNSKLSKCKTKSSSSITVKEGIKFPTRGSNKKK